VLVAATAFAVFAANGGMADAWNDFWESRAGLEIAGFRLKESLRHWVNDGLMTIFFFVIGLEIKRELVAGEFAEPRKVVLPVLAAAGGAALPALLFFALRRGTPDARGWAVPMATDIAFVVGILALLGPRVPHGLKVLVMSLAIVDDVFAVIVIAAFYSETIHAAWLAGALGGIVLVLALTRLGVRRITIYAVAGVIVWFCTLQSGVHPTVAGALLGLLTPARPLIEPRLSRGLLQSAAEKERLGAATAVDLAFAVRESVSPVDRIVRALHPWVAFLIMPTFALANAGVEIGEGHALGALPIAVAVGLVAGKPIGIAAGSWLAVRLARVTLPEGVSWRSLVAAGCLCGIGFTMSIFVAALAFPEDALDAAKSGILLGSLVAALLGAALLRAFLPRRELAATVRPA
jgi:NhaA family Na+:H+ antiporter